LKDVLTLDPLPNSNRCEYKRCTAENEVGCPAIQRTDIANPYSAVIPFATSYQHGTESQTLTDSALAGQDSGKNPPDNAAGDRDQEHLWHVHCGILC
jgi:hypothetical protein